MYFGGLHAVEKLSFDVKKGEIFGLIGPNGAGKTTVFNCITQFYKPTSGQLLFNDKQNQTIKLTDYAVHDIVLQGISRTFQNVEVIKEISVLENLLIAATRFYTSSILEHALHLPILRIEEKLIKDRALNLLELMGLSTYKDWYAYGLPYGILKKIEIARALMVQPKLIILDEPAAGLNDTETAELAKLIKRIRDEFNCTILLVEHDMSLVMSVCDRICAISFGKELATGTPKQIQADKSVQEAYLGVVEE
ncbi:MAG: ABC transporter ATP-binding protein [Clostridia bacterium]|nr:ABC transporter ATP-binding protein [Clostridia bacterium]